MPVGMPYRASSFNRHQVAIFMFEDAADRVVCDASSWTGGISEVNL
jgi:hypothetical protein